MTVVFDGESNLATGVTVSVKDENDGINLADSKRICASIGLTSVQKDNDGSGFYQWGKESDPLSAWLSPGDTLNIETK